MFPCRTSFRGTPTCKCRFSVAAFGGVICGSARGTTVEGTDSIGASSAGPRIAGSTPAKVPAPWRRPVPTTTTIHGGQPAMAVTRHRAVVVDPVPDADAVSRAGCTQSASALCVSTDHLRLFLQRETSPEIIGYTNAGYQSDPHNGRSQTGFVFLQNGTAIS
jgi:hypothetical protein